MWKNIVSFFGIQTENFSAKTDAQVWCEMTPSWPFRAQNNVTKQLSTASCVLLVTALLAAWTVGRNLALPILSPCVVFDKIETSWKQRVWTNCQTLPGNVFTPTADLHRSATLAAKSSDRIHHRTENFCFWVKACLYNDSEANSQLWCKLDSPQQQCWTQFEQRRGPQQLLDELPSVGRLEKHAVPKEIYRGTSCTKVKFPTTGRNTLTSFASCRKKLGYGLHNLKQDLTALLQLAPRKPRPCDFSLWSLCECFFHQLMLSTIWTACTSDGQRTLCTAKQHTKPSSMYNLRKVWFSLTYF